MGIQVPTINVAQLRASVPVVSRGAFMILSLVAPQYKTAAC